jgi:hypothetical protein
MILNKLFVKTVREHSSLIPLLAARCRDKMLVRISGGCGSMSAEQEAHLMSFATAFTGKRVTLIGGGTRMLYKHDLSIRPGVTELLPAIKAVAPHSQTIGIVPRIEDELIDGKLVRGHEMGFLPDGRIYFDNGVDDYVTTFMHQNDISLLIQKDVDTGARWEDEYVMAMKTMADVHTALDHRLLYFFYNGGGVSTKEMLHVAELGWEIVLVKGSGRMCDAYAENADFLMQHPNVHVITTPDELKTILNNPSESSQTNHFVYGSKHTDTDNSKDGHCQGREV